MPNEEDEEDTTTPDPAPTDSETDDDDQEQNNDPQPTAAELQAQLTALHTQLKTVNDESASRRIKLKKLEEKQRKKELSEMDDAERLQAELDDLKSQLTASETQAEQLETLNATIQTQVDALLKELKVPQHIQDLIVSLSPAQQLDYLNKNRKAFAGNGKRKPNIDADGKSATGGVSKKERSKKIQQRKRVSKRYTL